MQGLGDAIGEAFVMLLVLAAFGVAFALVAGIAGVASIFVAINFQYALIAAFAAGLISAFLASRIT